MTNKPKDINHASVEITRPPIYTAMKYWGKKPHNIWSEYIDNYTPANGVYLDPFCGSGVSIIEALRLGIKAIGFDLNPLSSFMIEIYTSDFNVDEFRNELTKITDFIEEDKIYNILFKYNNEYIHHLKWNKNEIYEVGVISLEGKKEKKKLRMPLQNDYHAYNFSENLDLDSFGFYYPNEPFNESPSFNANFIKRIGGNNFSNIWTKRNLYVLSLIYSKILALPKGNVKKQLLFGFIQTVHLCTKMNIPREDSAKRPFSTSWGRSAYLCADRMMEQNPLYVFKNSCLGKQSVESCLKSAKTYFKHPVKLKKVSESDKKKKDNSFDIKYGIVDINSIENYLEKASIDFIITDPPYGGLVQYLDLSYIWLSWLKKYDKCYYPNFNAEITIKDKIFDNEIYKKRLIGAFKKLHYLLKDNGKLVLTFHNKDLSVWNSFLAAIKESGFRLEKVIPQQNLRSGESVVANPYGTSGSDFYIRCVKESNVLTRTNDNVENTVLQAAINAISARNEPTAYQHLFNAILANLSSSGNYITDADTNIKNALEKHIGDIFELKENHVDKKAGVLWWFKEPSKYIKNHEIPLSERVERTVISILKRKISVTLDEVIREVFIEYPNGLTPDTYSIERYLKKYATKSQGKWLFNKLEFDKNITIHSKYLEILSKIGKSLGYQIFIGKREQPERVKDGMLKMHADYCDLNDLALNDYIRSRAEMIDMLWIKNKKIIYAIEIENSTNFTSAIQRASNLGNGINKYMVIPNQRENELLSMKDEFFVDGVEKYNWKYLLYSDIDKLSSSRQNLSVFEKRIIND